MSSVLCSLHVRTRNVFMLKRMQNGSEKQSAKLEKEKEQMLGRLTFLKPNPDPKPSAPKDTEKEGEGEGDVEMEAGEAPPATEDVKIDR